MLESVARAATDIENELEAFGMDEKVSEEVCRRCEGWGVIEDGLSKCLHCDGTGYIIENVKTPRGVFKQPSSLIRQG